jgi:2'-5' RNA ligase
MNTPSDPIRLFFALWPDEAVRRALSDWPLPCSGRAMSMQTLHTTLVFLGAVDQARLESLKLAAEEVVAQSFELCFDVARYWGHNHIVYAAPDVVPVQLQYLVSELERHLLKHHFVFELREYKPHVTLMRNVHWSDDPFPAMPPVHWRVSEFVLLQSVPEDADAHYRVLANFRLTE